MPTVTKADLVNRLAERDKLTPDDAGAALGIILGELKHAILEGRRIELRGFGSFQVRERKARTGRNPRDSKPVNVPAKQVTAFKPSPDWTARVNRG